MPGFNKYNAGYGELSDYSDAMLAGALKNACYDSVVPTTISPNDLFLDVPNSNGLSQLTTPSMYNGSPDDSENYDTSPMLQSMNSLNEDWFPLFQDSDAPLQHCTDITSTDGLDNFSSVVNATKSIEPNSTPLLHRLSTPSGVQKNRRTGKTLDPIELEELDAVSAKRAKNTMAARKSRQKKRDVEEQLRIELAAMTAERDRWMHAAIARGATPPNV